MVQTRRRARQRGAALLRLPTDVLRKIATHTVAPALVVAAGSNLEARTALRKGTDEAERSRFGGIGMTVREAEQVLRTRYRAMLDDSELESREAAGRAFDHGRIMIEYEWDWDDDAPIADINSDLIRTLVAYGADPNVQDLEFGATVLHVVAECAPPDAIDLSRLLLAAGADIDVECHPDNSAGRTPLAWCLACEPVTETSYELATFLIEQGCDVLKADVGYQAQAEQDNDHTLLEALENLDRTPANELILGLISAKLVAAGPERRETALNAARRSRDAWPPPANTV